MKIFAYESLVLATQHAQETPQGSPITQMLFFVSFIFLLYYFIYARPVAKDKESHEKMVNGLIKGDKIVSIGGICGEIVEVQDKAVLINVGRNSVCTITKTAIKAKLGEDNA